jgi:hypothetical protein
MTWSYIVFIVTSPLPPSFPINIETFVCTMSVKADGEGKCEATVGYVYTIRTTRRRGNYAAQNRRGRVASPRLDTNSEDILSGMLLALNKIKGHILDLVTSRFFARPLSLSESVVSLRIR